MSEPQTRVESMLQSLKIHPAIAVVMVPGIIVISIGDFFGSLGIIRSLMGFPSDEESAMKRALVDLQHRLTVSADNVAELERRAVGAVAPVVLVQEATSQTAQMGEMAMPEAIAGPARVPREARMGERLGWTQSIHRRSDL